MKKLNKDKKARKSRIVKTKNTKRVVISLLLATVGVVVYALAYQYTYQAKLEKQYNTVQSELETKRKTLLQSSNDKEQLKKQVEELNKQKQELEGQLQAKLSQKRALAESASITSVPVSGTCADWIIAAGINDVASASALIQNESGCNPNAINKYSGACGVAQELPCGKSGCALGDGACQVRWMNGYVIGRYGSWANAWATWNSRHPHWY